jgi:uncharacterized protein (DUF1330 family)
MNYENAVMPNDAQMKGFFENDHGKPICMVNLLKFKEKADYPQDHEWHGKEMSGAEAYALYGAEVTKVVEGLGGKMVFAGDVQRLMLGEVEELWDQVAIAQYPNRQAMVDMMMSKDYAAIAVHRDAGLAGQLNIETTEGDIG